MLNFLQANPSWYGARPSGLARSRGSGSYAIGQESALRTPTTHGDRLDRAPIGKLVLTETRHAPSLCLGWHAHENACLTMVTAGRYREEYRRAEHLCRPGTLLIKPAGVAHRNRYGDAGAQSVIYEMSEVGADAISWMGDPVCDHAGPASALGRRMLYESTIRDELTPLVVDGLLRAVLGLLSRNAAPPGGAPPRWLLRVRERLSDDFLTVPSVGELAAQAGVHPDHLARSFREHFGCLIGDFVRERRVEWAMEQIRRTENPLSRIALEAGFSDQSHFTRVFKAQVGTTPGRYRRVAAGG